jgi:hypothetical protein
MISANPGQGHGNNWQWHCTKDGDNGANVAKIRSENLLMGYFSLAVIVIQLANY